MSRLAILVLGMVLGAAAVVLTFSLWLDPGTTSAHERVRAQTPRDAMANPGSPSQPARPARPPGYPPAPSPVSPTDGLVSGPAANETTLDAPVETGASGTNVPLLPPSPAGLGLLVPVTGIEPRQLSDTFTQSRGAGRLHDAIDIMAPRGTPVVAVADGRVAKLFISKPGGLTMYQFDTEEKLAYYYAHLDSYAPSLVEGQQVRRGDVIGYVGSTGNANPDGPHLHFAIFVLGPDKKWWQGTAINPYPLLAGG